MDNTDKPFVSIIIPVYRNWEGLKTCLKFLAEQTYPIDSYEVLVVNNDPDTPPSFKVRNDNVILYDERTPGSYAARNTGLRHATGEIIGFTDSDCIPQLDWIEQAVSWFKGNLTISRLAGRIDITTRVPPQRTLAEVYERLFEFPQEVIVERQKTSVTANLFARRAVFDSVGGFDEQYLSGGDLEWGCRAQRAGFRIVYADDVVVSHPARNSYQALLKKARRVGAGKGTHTRQELLLAHIGMLKAFIPPLRMFGRALRFDVGTIERIAAMAIHYQLKLVKAFSRLQVAYGKRPPRA